MKANNVCPHDTIQECDCNMKANRNNKGKLQWHLVDFKSLEPLVQVLEYGAQKYGEDNWKLGLDIKETIDSLLRHVIALSQDDLYDNESNLHHIGHVLCNAMFLSYEYRKQGLLNNPKKLTWLEQQGKDFLDNYKKDEAEFKDHLYKQYKQPESKKEGVLSNDTFLNYPDPNTQYCPGNNKISDKELIGCLDKQHTLEDDINNIPENPGYYTQTQTHPIPFETNADFTATIIKK